MKSAVIKAYWNRASAYYSTYARFSKVNYHKLIDFTKSFRSAHMDQVNGLAGW